jgi:30S ribosome assembly GTPase
MIKKCSGCGVELQNINKNRIGYTPKNLFDVNYCERCFKIINYNDAKIVTLDKEEKDIIDIINNKAKYVLFLIDVLNINSDTVNTFKKIKISKSLIVSKYDLLPKSVNKNKIKEWLKNEYDINDNIMFCSALKNINLRPIVDYLEKNNIKTTYVLGYTNSGKSTLINSIFNKYQDNKSMITTSLIPNTTLDFIKLKVNENLTLIDSPGFIQKSYIKLNNDIDLLKKLNTKSTIKPITIQIKEDMLINIDNKVIIRNLTGNNSMTFYLPNEIPVNKTFKYKVINGFEKNIYDLDEEIDIVIKGFGFINVKKACELEISTTNHNIIEIRNSFFSGDRYE